MTALLLFGFWRFLGGSLCVWNSDSLSRLPRCGVYVVLSLLYSTTALWSHWIFDASKSIIWRLFSVVTLSLERPTYIIPGTKILDPASMIAILSDNPCDVCNPSAVLKQTGNCLHVYNMHFKTSSVQDSRSVFTGCGMLSIFTAMWVRPISSFCCFRALMKSTIEQTLP